MSEPHRWTCAGCTSTWTGLSAQHCPACHETFGGTTAGDKHRTRDFRCLAPAEVGLTLDGKGVWRFPITPEAREKLASLGGRAAVPARALSGAS